MLVTDYECTFYQSCTLKTDIPIEDLDPILKLLRGVSRPDIQLGVASHSELDFFFTAVHG